MKIIMIRHGKVNMTWESTYNSEGFDEANAIYDAAPLFDYGGTVETTGSYKVYVSALSRTMATAKQIFSTLDNPTKTELLNEVPKRSFMDTKTKLPRWLWVAMSRIGWFINSKRQVETRRESKERAEELIKLIEKDGSDCILISHEFFLYTLNRALRKRGYSVKRNQKFRIKNWERITAFKN